MKETIRENVWETNSSTSHSMIILPERVYKKWESENSYIYCGDSWFEKELRKNGVSEDKIPKVNQFYTKDEVVEILKLAGYMTDTEKMDEDDYEECLRESVCETGFYTYDGWNGDSDYSLEESTYYYTSESGDKIVIRAKYGYDG